MISLASALYVPHVTFLATTGAGALQANDASVSEAATTETGLSMSEILASLPTDPASIFSLLLLLGCTVLVLRYGLKTESNDKKMSDHSESSTSGPFPQP